MGDGPRSRDFDGSSTAWLLAVGAVAISNGLVLPFLPVWVGDAASGRAIAALAAIHPLAGACSAPLWARAVERIGGRSVLVLGLVGYALSFAALGPAALPALAALRALNGIFAAAVIPTVFTLAAHGAQSQRCARNFAWLNGLILAGDLGAFVASRSFDATAALAPGLSATIIGAVAVFVWITVRQAPVLSALASHPAPRSGPPYVLIAVAAGAAMALLHTSMIAMRAQPHAIGAGLLGACGLIMVAAQFVPVTHRCVAAAAPRLVAPLLIVLAAGLALGSLAASLWALAAAFLLAGWSAASLRLLSAYLAAKRPGPSAARPLAGQFAATNAGQSAASLVVSLSGSSAILGLGAILLAGLAIWMRRLMSPRQPGAYEDPAAADSAGERAPR